MYIGKLVHFKYGTNCYAAVITKTYTNTVDLIVFDLPNSIPSAKITGIPEGTQHYTWHRLEGEHV